MSELKTKILLRSDTSENWAKTDVPGAGANTKLMTGEIGIELLSDGYTKIKIGDNVHTWSQLPYFSGEMPDIPSANVYEVSSYEQLPTSGVAKGDTGIVKSLIFTGETEDKNKYSYTGYVFNGERWVAMDGNYNADNVILTGDVQLSGDYTKVGNIEKATEATVSTYDWNGMSVRQMFENILSKVLYPTKPTPSVASWSLTNAGAKEIGTTITPSFKVKYDPKTYAYGSKTNETAGSGTYAAGSVVTITLNDGNTLTGNIGGDGSDEKEITISGNSMVVTSSTSYKGTSVSIDYTQGAIPLTNTGIEHANAQVQAGTCTSTNGGAGKDNGTNAITHYREGCFYGTSSIANFDSDTHLTNSLIRGLNKLNGNYSATTKTLSVGVGTTAIIIACPVGKSGPSSVLNTTVNAEMWGDNFVKTTVSVGGADSTSTSVGSYATDYNVWVYKPAEAYGTAASLTIKLG